MTVAELIAKLQEFPPETEAVIKDDEYVQLVFDDVQDVKLLHFDGTPYVMISNHEIVVTEPPQTK